MKRYQQILEAADIILRLTEAEKPKFPKGPGLGTIGYGVNLDDPRRFVGSNQPLQRRKTDARGNIISKPVKGGWAASRKITQDAITTAKDMIMTLAIKPVGIKIEIMGVKNGQPHSMFIRKVRMMGKDTYATMSGKEVELKAAGTGLQVLDKASRRVMLDRGEDMLWD
jgi:hypothetical protein